MTPEHFITLLNAPEHLSGEDGQNLEYIVEAFPFFQAARALRLKALKNAQSFRYNQALKTTAAHTTDRGVLFDFITSEVFNQNNISQQISLQMQTAAKDMELHGVEDISRAPKKVGPKISKQTTEGPSLEPLQKTAREVFDLTSVDAPEHSGKPDIETKHEAREKEAYTQNELASTRPQDHDVSENSLEAIGPLPEQEESPQKTLKLEQPLEFDQNERHSFAEWLQLSALKPIGRTDEPSGQFQTPPGYAEEEPKISAEDNSGMSKAEKFKLIEDFIDKNPKIKPVLAKEEHKRADSEPSFDLASYQMIQPEALMTETLARIYLEQKNYKKAIQAFKILSLKYPEKSGFFADQIRAIKKLSDNS